MRTVFLGTSDFAATVLARLAESEHRPDLVVTRPARPRGRGRNLHDPPVAELARDLGIEAFAPENVNEAGSVARIRAHGPESICVCAFGAIIKDDLLTMATNLNVHPSLLPRWRGAAPVERAIAAGDVETGATIMRLVAELDAGPLCAQERIPIAPGDDYGKIAPRLAELGANLLVEALDRIADGVIKWIDQETLVGEQPVTYAEKITRIDRVLMPTSAPAVELERMIRALTPHIGAMLETVSGDPLRVESALAYSTVAAAFADGPGDDVVGISDQIDTTEIAPGVIEVRHGRLLVGTIGGVLELLRVKPAGGKAMAVDSFLRGNAVPELMA